MVVDSCLEKNGRGNFDLLIMKTRSEPILVLASGCFVYCIYCMQHFGLDNCISERVIHIFT